jgi:hypothetical protein
MKVVRPAVSALMLAICIVNHGQTSSTPVAPSDAQKAFDLMKTLAGSWQGAITTDNPAWSTDKPLPLTIHVASRGYALVHELSTPGPEITVFYLDNDGLNLTHYCDFGNRPHLVARPSPEGKTVEFDLTEFAGSDAIGHVSHAIFTILDANHHTEDWTFLPAGSKPVHAHIEFKRTQ